MQNFEFQYVFLGLSEKRIEYFLGMKILWICFGVITKLNFLGGHFYAF